MKYTLYRKKAWCISQRFMITQGLEQLFAKVAVKEKCEFCPVQATLHLTTFPCSVSRNFVVTQVSQNAACVYTAISRNVVGKKPQKTAQANPERYFG